MEIYICAFMTHTDNLCDMGRAIKENLGSNPSGFKSKPPSNLLGEGKR